MNVIQTDHIITIDEASNAQPAVYDVVPNTSINGIRLISPRLEVRKKLGKVLKSGTFRYINGMAGYYDVFNGCTVYYNNRLYSEEFVVYAGTVRVNRFQIFPGTVKEFVKCFPDAYQVADGWISKDYAMGIQEENGTLKELHICYEGYYDR